jgi:hypothetical protein
VAARAASTAAYEMPDEEPPPGEEPLLPGDPAAVAPCLLVSGCLSSRGNLNEDHSPIMRRAEDGHEAHRPSAGSCWRGRRVSVRTTTNA